MLHEILTFVQATWDRLPEAIKGNQFLGAGFLLAPVMFLCNSLRALPGKLWSRVRREIMLEATIHEKDEAFALVKEWLSQQSFSARTRNMEISLHPGVRTQEGKRPRPRFIVSPGYGTHFFFYKGRLVWLTRSKDEGSIKGGGELAQMLSRENITMRFFSRSRGIVEQMLNDIITTVLPEGEPFLTTYRYRGSYTGWVTIHTRKLKNCRNLILPEGVFEDLSEDLKTFIDARDWYEQMGLPHRRGYLLHGEPGSGKSTTVLCVAAHLQMDVAVLSISDAGMDDTTLNAALAGRPSNALLLLEDVDCIFNQRKEEDKSSRVTFSGLLNAIDGVDSTDGTIIFMTTNHIARLDPALIRPGRADRKIEYRAATAEQARRMFSHFFPGTNGAGEEFAAAVTPRGLSMCCIQEYLVRHRDNPALALAGAGEAETWAEMEGVSAGDGA